MRMSPDAGHAAQMPSGPEVMDFTNAGATPRDPIGQRRAPWRKGHGRSDHGYWSRDGTSALATTAKPSMIASTPSMIWYGSTLSKS